MLKIAKVKPLFKRGDTCTCQLNNYRLISLLPTISKIFERIVYSQLYAYFSQNNLLSEEQYGFRAQHSTELASVKLVDYVIKEMDDAQSVKTPVTIYCDLSKAFDCLNFDIFLSKMEYYGVSGTPLFLEKKIYFHKTNLQKKSYIQYQTHYIQKKRNEGKKETRNIKRRKKKEMGGSHYVIHTIDRHNPFKLFSLYTFYAID